MHRALVGRGVERLDHQVVVGPRDRLTELRALGDHREQLIDQRAVAAEQPDDARAVQPAL